MNTVMYKLLWKGEKLLQALLQIIKQIDCQPSRIMLCISKINNTFTANAEDLDITVSMYNLLEYSKNYSMTPGDLWNYYTDEVNDDANEINADNYRIYNSKTVASESFKCKTKAIWSKPANNNDNNNNNNNNNTLDTEVVVLLKYLSYFGGFFRFAFY